MQSAALMRHSAERSISAKRMAESFDDEIRRLWARPDGFALFSRNLHGMEGAADQLLRRLAELPESWRAALANRSVAFYSPNPEAWLSADFEGAGFTPKQAAQLRRNALDALVGRNPERAVDLLAAGDVDVDAPNRERILEQIFRNLSRQPDKAQGLLAKLDSEDDRRIASGAMESANRNPGSQRQYKSPADWIGRIEAGELTGNDWLQMQYATREWTREQVSELTRRFTELGVEQKNEVAKIACGSGGGHFDFAGPALSGEIVRHAIEHPDVLETGSGSSADPARQITQMASQTAVQWVLKDPAAAMNPGKCHGAVHGDDRSGFEKQELIVDRKDARPVGARFIRGKAMASGDAGPS